MSDNKYIIDKDSLTGIADAVRDKLGNGSSIDDPGKGYYPAPHIASSFSVKSLGYSVSPSSSETYYWCVIDNYSLYFDKPFTAVEISWTSNKDANLTINNYSVNNKLSSCTVTFGNPQNSLFITTTNGNIGYQYEDYSYDDIVIKLKDENGNYLIPKQNQLSYKAGSVGPPENLPTYTTNFQSELVPTPIPMSLTDINNNILTYLTLSSDDSGGGLKIFKCYNNSSIRSSEGDGWKVSNYLKFNAYFDLNFSSTSPSYITTQVPDLNPENIIFIWYIGSKQSSGSTYTRSFIFDPTLKDVEHYTSASSSNGKRLSSTTDYYFFPDGAGTWSTSNDYGIMGMWDATNKILDLGLQKVSSRSGTYVASNYTTQYYNTPEKLIIVYKT